MNRTTRGWRGWCAAAAWILAVGHGLAVFGQESESPVELVVLGIAQDAGYPQANCDRACCAAAWEDRTLRRMVSCLGIRDRSTGERWMLDCTPDFPQQLRDLQEGLPPDARVGERPPIDGIFLTHAHIGHYTGLMFLGREAMGARQIPVFAMPRMRQFLTRSGPWSQLVELGNISLQPLEAGEAIALNERIRLLPLVVPHRDEFSETVGFVVHGPQRSALFLPDIDKWSRWDQSIEDWIGRVDFAFLDGTFLADGEIPGRDMGQIPHPFIAESLSRFSALDGTERAKVKFIHLNHTNPALNPDAPARSTIRRAGMSVASEGEVVSL